MRPILFYTVGLPGAGKTTLARGLAILLAAEHLRGDKIGIELFRFPTYSPEERRIVYQEMANRAAEHLRAGRPVLYDAATNTAAQREQLARLAAEAGGEAIGVWVHTQAPVAKKRAGQARDSGLAGAVVRVIPPHIFDQYAAAFEAPSAHENIVELSGEAYFYLQYRRLARQLRARGVRLPRLI
ncbi:MAG TPA: ATP-binding protein [Candidatus Saccharimonadales bacterium]